MQFLHALLPYFCFPSFIKAVIRWDYSTFWFISFSSKLFSIKTSVLLINTKIHLFSFLFVNQYQTDPLLPIKHYNVLLLQLRWCLQLVGLLLRLSLPRGGETAPSLPLFFFLLFLLLLLFQLLPSPPPAHPSTFEYAPRRSHPRIRAPRPVPSTSPLWLQPAPVPPLPLPVSAAAWRRLIPQTQLPAPAQTGLPARRFARDPARNERLRPLHQTPARSHPPRPLPGLLQTSHHPRLRSPSMGSLCL